MIMQVKEVIISFFILMEQGKATRQACLTIVSLYFFLIIYPKNRIYDVDSLWNYWCNFLLLWNRISIYGVRI